VLSSSTLHSLTCCCWLIEFSRMDRLSIISFTSLASYFRKSLRRKKTLRVRSPCAILRKVWQKFSKGPQKRWLMISVYNPPKTKIAPKLIIKRSEIKRNILASAFWTNGLPEDSKPSYIGVNTTRMITEAAINPKKKLRSTSVSWISLRINKLRSLR